MSEKYYSLPQLAKILGISRIAVYKKVKKGQIFAEKIGRNFAVPVSEFPNLAKKVLTAKEKQIIDAAVKKTVSEYSETLKLLGQG
jgi:excisionase family DNA binding protein